MPKPSTVEIKAGMKLRNVRSGQVVTVMEPPAQGKAARVLFSMGPGSIFDLRRSMELGVWVEDGHQPEVKVAYRLIYRPFDYRTMEYTGQPKVMEVHDKDFVAADRLALNRSVSGAPEEWWVEKVTITTERLEL